MVELEELVRVGERFVVVLPKSVRKMLSLKKGDLLRVSVEGERIVMTPVKEEAFEVFRRVLSGIEWSRKMREECEKALVGEAR
ncbi:MAG: AbrB/MazE/SpoVT family DNA-binding domain-containing protein [Candidatus Jordarchaeales archaeon]